jgi:hypothetical protein
MDPTDTALAACAGIGLAVCAACALGYAWRTALPPRMKESRSDPDLESLREIVSDSLPSHK